MNIPILKRDLVGSGAAPLLAEVIGDAFEAILSAVADVAQVTPLLFGAVGNGTTDDSAAIQACIDFTSSRGGGDVSFPPMTFYCGTTTITVPINVTVQAQRSASLRYDGHGVALDIWGSVVGGSRNMVLPAIKRKGANPEWDAGDDTTSCGVRLNACHNDVFKINEIRNFCFGLVFRATPNSGDQVVSGNCTANTINLGRIINCWKGLSAEWFAGGGGYAIAGCNQNTVNGGVIRVDSLWSHEEGSIYVSLPDAENNGWQFNNVNLEKGANKTGVYCNSLNNVFIDPRLELANAGYFTFGPSAVNNKIISGHSGSTSDGYFDSIVVDQGYGNSYWFADVLACRGFMLDFNAGVIKMGGGLTVPSVPIQGYGSDRLRLGDTSTTAVRHYGAILGEEVEVTSVGSGDRVALISDIVKLNFSDAVTITGRTGGADATVTGKLTLFDRNGNVTLTHTASPADGTGRFVLRAGVNLSMSAMSPVCFTLVDGNYYQD